MKKTFLFAAAGFFAGFLNGLFGSGGGIIAVPLLGKNGLSQKESQATALFVTVCLSAVSVFLYHKSGVFSFDDAFGFIPMGILGAVFAAVFFKKIKSETLRKIFGGFVLFSGGKMLLEMIL